LAGATGFAAADPVVADGFRSGEGLTMMVGAGLAGTTGFAAG
jgi:hypothetical protein